MMLANLRGTKESGRVFAPPVYIYILSLAALIGYGLYQSIVGDLGPMPPNRRRPRRAGRSPTGPSDRTVIRSS